MSQGAMRSCWAVSSAAGNLSGYLIDSSRLLSLMNKRLYRQGLNYRLRVKLAVADDTQDDDFIGFNVYRVPKLWWFQQAYRKAAIEWWKQGRKALKTLPAAKLPRWFDFRLQFSTSNYPEVLQAQVPAWDSVAGQIVFRDWLAVNGYKWNVAVHGDAAPDVDPEVLGASALYDNAGHAFELALFGDSDVTTSYIYGIIAEYDRGHQIHADLTEIDVDSDEMPYYEVQDPDDDRWQFWADSETLKGDNPPYDAQRLETPLEYMGTLHDGNTYTGEPYMQTPWMECPLGWVLLQPLNVGVDLPYVSVEWAPGGYKGVDAGPIWGGRM